MRDVLRPSGGFTLVELMLVVGLIGLLAMIAIPNYHKFLKKAKGVEAESALQEIQRLEAEHFIAQGVFSPDLTVLGFAMNDMKLYQVALTVGTTTTIWTPGSGPNSGAGGGGGKGKGGGAGGGQGGNSGNAGGGNAGGNNGQGNGNAGGQGGGKNGASGQGPFLYQAVATANLDNDADLDAWVLTMHADETVTLQHGCMVAGGSAVTFGCAD